MGFLGNLFAGPIFKFFGDSIVTPLLQYSLKAKDVDLEKFKASNANNTELAAHMLEANVRFAEKQFAYNGFILGYWPFRLVLFVLLAVTAMRAVSIFVDATLPHILGYPAWDIDPLRGAYAGYEKELLEFFIVAKPVDSAVTGVTQVVMRYLNKDR